MTGFSASVRATVHDRSDRVCERCGMNRGVHLHHRRARGRGGSRRPDTNEAANGLWLCFGCHDWVETHRAEAFLNGWVYRGNVTDCEQVLTDAAKEMGV